VGEEEGLHYIVMELLEGVTLKQYINSKGGKLSRREATNFSMQICRALEHAHSKHVVHRDIKPQNIVITDSGKIKVADFGIARAANNTTTVNSGKNAIGSAHYLSPEQARGGYTDLRSDIYSLGIVMYEMFTGKLPFDAEETVSVIMQHLHEEPLLPSDIDPDLPMGIEAIILRCMKKEQRLRYNNATEILEDLVMVYQNPSINITALNAVSGEGGEKIAMPKKRNQNASGKRPISKKKKKKSSFGKWMFLGITVLLIAFISVLVPIMKFLTPIFFTQSEELQIPNMVGLQYEQALAKAERSSGETVKFTLRKKDEFSNEPKGTVISQTPKSGTVKKSREITVLVSRGGLKVADLENYTGKKATVVKAQLEEKGLIVTIVQEENSSSDYPEGIIVSQHPSKGKAMAAGEEVTLTVSKGSKTTIIPNVLGDSKETAMSEIEALGLVVGDIIHTENSDYTREQVCNLQIGGKDVKPGDKVNSGSVVDIYISKGEPEDSGIEGVPQDDPTNSETDREKPGKKKSVSVRLSNLPRGNGSVAVRLVLDGVCVYESDVSSSSGSATVSFEVNAGADFTKGIDTYYDGAFINTIYTVTIHG
ncbi:MAG: protein kinase, partial [Clostridia bacterium]|nr:protein kinase [Clostridia bacterium]